MNDGWLLRFVEHLLEWSSSIWSDEIAVHLKDCVLNYPQGRSEPSTWSERSPSWSASPILMAWSLSTVPWLWWLYGGLTRVGSDISRPTCSWSARSPEWPSHWRPDLVNPVTAMNFGCFDSYLNCWQIWNDDQLLTFKWLSQRPWALWDSQLLHELCRSYDLAEWRSKAFCFDCGADADLLLSDKQCTMTWKAYEWASALLFQLHWRFLRFLDIEPDWLLDLNHLLLLLSDSNAIQTWPQCRSQQWSDSLIASRRHCVLRIFPLKHWTLDMPLNDQTWRNGSDSWSSESTARWPLCWR